MEYPVKFSKCPVCGSEKRIVEAEAQQEIKSGKLPEGAMVPAILTKSFLYDPKNITNFVAKREILVILTCCDICAECGTLYCVEAQKQVAVVDPYAQQGNIPNIT